jgi:hypothetical protein
MKNSLALVAAMTIGLSGVTAHADGDRGSTRNWRLPNGDLLQVGMIKAEAATAPSLARDPRLVPISEVVSRFRQPDNKDALTTGEKCELKIEVWNYYLGKDALALTFTGNDLTNIQHFQINR